MEVNLEEKEMLEILKKHYSLINYDCEPDYIFYLMIKDFYENKNLNFLRNDYGIYYAKDYAKKLLSL